MGLAVTLTLIALDNNVVIHHLILAALLLITP